jgi:hypothetical protein
MLSLVRIRIRYQIGAPLWRDDFHTYANDYAAGDCAALPNCFSTNVSFDLDGTQRLPPPFAAKILARLHMLSV